jgi:hypothetical protein
MSPYGIILANLPIGKIPIDDEDYSDDIMEGSGGLEDDDDNDDYYYEKNYQDPQVEDIMDEVSVVSVQ